MGGLVKSCVRLKFITFVGKNPMSTVKVFGIEEFSHKLSLSLAQKLPFFNQKTHREDKDKEEANRFNKQIQVVTLLQKLL